MQEASETCYETIQKSWSKIERVASQPNGLSILSQRFNTCRYKHYFYPLRFTFEFNFDALPA